MKKDNIYSPLYKMFDDIKNDYFNIEELKSDFEYLDTEKWDEIEHSENNLFISNKLRDLMGKFFDTYMNLLDVWENCVKSVIDQYNIIAKEVNGLEELCTEERKSFIMDYDREILQMQKFTFALVFKKYEMAFDYIIPNKEFHIRFEGVDDNKIDSHDLVINNKENIIERFKSIKIDDAMMKSYNSLKNKVEEIIKYLSKEIRK